MNYKLALNYLKRLYNIRIFEDDGTDILIETEMLYLQFVMTELYTSGFSNFVTTIVDSEHVQIRTETVE